MKRIKTICWDNWAMAQKCDAETFQILYCPGMVMFDGVADDGV